MGTNEKRLRSRMSRHLRKHFQNTKFIIFQAEDRKKRLHFVLSYVICIHQHLREKKKEAASLISLMLLSAGRRFRI